MMFAREIVLNRMSAKFCFLFVFHWATLTSSTNGCSQLRLSPKVNCQNFWLIASRLSLMNLHFLVYDAPYPFFRSFLHFNLHRVGLLYFILPTLNILSILFYSILFYSILFYSILFYILFYSIFYSILFYSIFYILFYILFYSILFSILSYIHSILFYILFYSIL